MVPARSRTSLHVLLVIVVAVAVAASAFVLTRDIRRPVHPKPVSGVAVPNALASAGAPVPSSSASAVAQVPIPAAVAKAVAASLKAPNLGPQVLVRVTDAISGAVLFDQLGATPAAPASTAKLMTAAAILAVRPASYRFTTLVRAAHGTIVLVGGGDPTLTGAAPGKDGPYAGAGRISDLAAQIKASHVAISRIVVDESLFTGPSVLPGWAPEDVPSGYCSAITAVLADGGRPTPASYYRTATPDLAAGHELAAALGQPALPVSRGVSPAGATQVAAVKSAPLSTLVEQMLHESDNVIAEVLARQVALAKSMPASFAGGVAAIRAVLAGLGVEVGAGMKDGSGLAASDRVSPATLVNVLRLVAGELKPTNGAAVPSAMSLIVTALPVAAWSGTLINRYSTGAEGKLGGQVRAKTGSIDGITTLSGYVRDRSGRLLVFSMDADRTPIGGTRAAEYALDAVVTAIASCGCS